MSEKALTTVEPVTINHEEIQEPIVVGLSSRPILKKRTSPKIQRPQTPPGLRKLLGRLEKRRNMRKDDRNVFSSSDESNADTPEDISAKTKPHRTSQPRPLPDIKLPVENVVEQPNPVDASNTFNKENDPTQLKTFPTKSTSDLDKLSSNVHRLIQVDCESPLNDLIVPTDKRNGIETPRNQFLLSRSILLAKRLSPSTPLTPDALLQFVNSAHTPKLKKNVQSTNSCPKSITRKRKRIIRVVARMPKELKKTVSGFKDNNSESECEDTGSCNSAKPSKEKLIGSSQISRSNSSKTTKKDVLADNALPNHSRRQAKDTSNLVRVQKANPLSRLRRASNVDLDSSRRKSYRDRNQQKIPVKNDSSNADTAQRRSGRILAQVKSITPVSSTQTMDNRKSISRIRNNLLDRSLNEFMYDYTEDHSRDSISLSPMRSKRFGFKFENGFAPLSERTSLDEFMDRNQVPQVIKPMGDAKHQTRFRIAFTGTHRYEEATLVTLLETSPLEDYRIVHTTKDINRNVIMATATRSARTKQEIDVTHLVTTVPFRRTVKLFRALLQGVHIVSMDWLKDCAQMQKWVPEAVYRPEGLPSLSTSRLLHRLFVDIGPIYVGSITNPPRLEMVGLLELGGATLTNKQTLAAVAIGIFIESAKCVKTAWVLVSMKFRIKTNDGGCIEQFSNIVQMVAGLAKNTIFRLTKDHLTFIVKERAVYGGISAWCEVDHANFFSERVCEGISPDQDEILLEVVMDNLVHCLRVSSSTTGNSSTMSSMSSGNKTRMGAMNMTGGAFSSFGQSSASAAPVVHGLKIKLVRRKVPCLAIELEQSSVTGRCHSVWHFLPVHVVPPRLWDEFIEPADPDFDVSIFFPPIKTLRPFIDRMKKFAKFVIISANGAGELNFGVNVETLARVRLTFRGLRARSWLSNESEIDPDAETEEPRSAVWAGREDEDKERQLREDTGQANDADKRFVSVNLDIRRVAQLLSSPRLSPSWFVCNIVHEQMVQFIYLFDNCKLKLNMPACNL